MIDGPNPKKRKDLTIKDHSSESKAFSKSIKSNSPGMFFSAAYWMMQSISRTFSPINLPFMNPVRSLLIRLGSTDLIRFARAFAAIL